MKTVFCIQNSATQDYLPELYRLSKNASFDFPLLAPPGVDCPPLSRAFVGNSGDGGRIPPKC